MSVVPHQPYGHDPREVIQAGMFLLGVCWMRFKEGSKQLPAPRKFGHPVLHHGFESRINDAEKKWQPEEDTV